MRDKIKWTYTAYIHGGNKLNGSLMAADSEEATKLIKQFGFLNWRLTDPTGIVIESEHEVPPAPPGPAPAPAPQMPMPMPILPKLVPPSVQQPSMVPAPSPSAPRETFRLQHVIVGPKKEVLPKLEEAFNTKGNVRVMHTNMHPDAHGEMFFLFVIEYDEEKKK